MEDLGFVGGVVVGVMAAGVLGFFLQKIRLAQKRMGAHRRPQKVFLETDLTPAEVVRDSAAGGASCVGWGIALVVVLALLGMVFRALLMGD